MHPNPRALILIWDQRHEREVVLQFSQTGYISNSTVPAKVTSMGIIGQFALKFRRALGVLLLSLSVAAIAHDTTNGIPLGLPALPAGPASSLAGCLVGEKLFSDPRLSGDGAVSCASCHLPEKQFTDARVLASGVGRQAGTRNTPSLLNVVYSPALFWDGRATSLESQAILPLLNPREHGLGSEADVLVRIQQVPQYRPLFDRWLGSRHRISIADVTTAIATYERTLLSGDSAFDRYLYGADPNAISAAAIRGLELFRNRGHCENCHTIGKDFALFTDQAFHSSSLGIPAAANAALVELTHRVLALRQENDTRALNALVVRDPAIAALGRFIVTLDPRDIGLFKTPSLRNVALTAPYFHDGSAATLIESIDLELYNRGDATRDPIIMSSAEKADLMEFLKTLSSPSAGDSCVAAR